MRAKRTLTLWRSPLAAEIDKSYRLEVRAPDEKFAGLRERGRIKER